jgi:hypothetical protein
MICPQAVDTRMVAANGIGDGGSAGLDGIISPADLAESVVQGLRDEIFMILPHAEVEQYRQSKAASYQRWIGGMRKLRRRIVEASR